MKARPRTTSRAAWRAFAVAAAWLLVAASARGDGRVHFLSERLAFPPVAGQSDDFRVRTNAALALGATDSDAAVAPLCAALADPSEIVRQAVAVALKRLARSASLECLQSRASVEASPPVKKQIQQAIDAIAAAHESETARSDGGGGGARFYVSLSRVVNHTSRSPDEIERIVHDAIVSKLAEMGGYRLAPSGESSESAKGVIARGRLKGYYLSVSVDKFEYSDEGLRARVKIAVFSYPGKDLRGEVPAGAILPGVRPADRGSEDRLVTIVAARAAELFAQNFQ